MMGDSDTATTAQSCPLIDLMRQSSSRNGLIAVTVLIAINIVPALLTIFANSVLLLTMAKTHSLHTPSNTFLAALCFSDLLVGAVSQPIFFILLFKIQSLQEPAPILSTTLKWSGIILNGMSFFIVLLITMDRYVAVCHPFLYEQKATIKKYCTVVAVTWLYKIVIPFATGSSYMILYGVSTALAFILMFYCYIRIYTVIAQKERSVFRLGRIGEDERHILRHNKEERSKTYTLAVLLVVFTLSYLPLLAATLVAYVKYRTVQACSLSPNTALFVLWSIFLMNISSAINPVVYCIFIKPIKKAAVKLLFKGSNRVFAL